MSENVTAEERARRLAALIEWVATDEAHEEVRLATERAREDAEMFLRMDQIDPDVYFDPMTL